jgi:hypothetical protein
MTIYLFAKMIVFVTSLGDSVLSIKVPKGVLNRKRKRKRKIEIEIKGYIFKEVSIAAQAEGNFWTFRSQYISSKNHRSVKYPLRSFSCVGCRCVFHMFST